MKLALIGDGAVGKTALRQRYLGQGFKSTYISTVGADFSVIQELVRGELFRYQIWDLAGQPKFGKVRSLYYSGTKGFLLVYDVIRPSTYENVLNWVQEIRSYLPKNGVPSVLVGNKTDLRDTGDPSHITTEMGVKLVDLVANELNMENNQVLFVETSAKTGYNVTKTFHQLGEMIHDQFIS